MRKFFNAIHCSGGSWTVFCLQTSADPEVEGVDLTASVDDPDMLGLVITFMVSVFVYRSIGPEVYALVFADNVLDFPVVVLEAFFVKLPNVRLVVTKGRRS